MRELKKKGAPKRLFAVYLEPKVLARLDRVAEAYAKLLPGSRILRSEAGRAAIHVGLDAIERKLRATGRRARKEQG